MNAPASHLPAAARRQVRAAAAVQAQVQAGNIPAAIAAAPPQPAAPAAAAAPPNLPNVNIDMGPETRWVPASQGQPAQAAAPQSEPVQAQQPAAPGPGVAAQPVSEPWEQRYKVLEGKYRSELGRASGLIENQGRMIEQLQQQLNARPVQQQPAPAADPAQQMRNLGATDEQVKEFGPDLVQMVATIAQNAAGQAVAPVNRQVQQTSRTVQEQAADHARANNERMWMTLRAAVPDVELINASQEFVDWCALPDIFSGQPRQVGLMQAFQNGDATRVIGILNAFKEEDASSRTTANARIPQVDPATLYAPGQGRVDGSAAPVTGASGKIWSEQEIRDYYSRVQRGRVKPDERAAMAAEIALAQREGRIKPDHTTSHLLNQG